MMKHANSAASESEKEFDNIEVISNDNASFEDEKHEMNELPDIQTNGKDMKNNANVKSGSIDRENYYLPKENPSSTTTTKAKQYNKPILPKVFIALLVILILAVIALSFVLYHLDSELRSNKEKGNSRLGYLETELEKGIDGSNLSLYSIRKYLDEIAVKADKNNQSLEAMLRDYKMDVSVLNDTSIRNEKELSDMKEDFQSDISQLKNKSIVVEETTEQLDMYMQYEENYKGKMGLSFADVLKLTGEEVRVNKPVPTLILLTYQFNVFTSKYEQKWQIEYQEVLRLTDKIDFKVNQPIPLLEKIDTLHRIFIQQFSALWKILFNDVIRLTTMDDIKSMSVYSWFQYKANEQIPPVLQKIHYMYQEFMDKYEKKWNITFKEVISLTDNLDYRVNESIPILLEIDGWYFLGFEETWGDGFPEYVQVMMSTKDINRTEILEKLQYIRSQGKLLRFLPGTFINENGNLAVYGYVALFREAKWTTINNAQIQDKEANVICRTGKYASGLYDKGKYNKGNMSRDSLAEELGFLYCKGTERVVDECSMAKGNPWPHEDDTGVKCYF